MKIKELIEKLRDYPEDMEVWILKPSNVDLDCPPGEFEAIDGFYDFDSIEDVEKEGVLKIGS